MSESADHQSVTPIAIEQEMRSSFMDYAMSVIVSRALPDARDGLKPVHRRILFAQKGLSNHWNRPYLKCARIVGDVIGKYHPHGDSAVYDALVRLAQDFSMRYQLIDGQGNFGSIDGDPPAAMRYTECRMRKLASELLADLDKETVDWQPNYDDKELEPMVMPTKVPNLLINGATGIAVGMATNIPPHNLGEILDACLAMIENPEIDDTELIQIVPGPDFPTGGIIQGRSGIQSAYRMGRGSIPVRGVAAIEEIRKDRYAVVVTEVPYQVNKSRWITATAALVRDKKLEGISDIRDESDRTGIRVVFELKRDANEQVVLNNLYKMTQLQTSFSANMLAIVNGRPEVLTLRKALQVFLRHRREVVTRRTLFDLRQARERREIVEGLGLAVLQIDRVIEIIRSSKDTDEAKARLMAEKMGGLDGFLERAGRPEAEVLAVREAGFVHLSGRQAQAILDMRLGRLTGLEREKLEAEYRELWDISDYLEGLLGDDEKLMAAIVEELEQIKRDYADPRRTQIVDQAGEFLDEELIAEEDMIVTRTHLGYVKRTSVSEYSAQGRGGKGVKGAASADDDFVADLFAASTHDHVLIFTNKGRVYHKKVYELPAGGRTSKGKPLVNVVSLQDGERTVGMLPVKEFSDDHHIFFACRSGTVKKTVASAFSKIRATGIIAIGIDEDDQLVDVRITDDATDVLLATSSGYSIRFQESQVRAMGREARGVRGINLRGEDILVGMAAFQRDDTSSHLLTVSENGYGKRTSLDEYPAKNRGGMGVINIRTNERNGPVSAVRVVSDDHHIILISDQGKLIRMLAADVSIQGRSTQGVRIMRVSSGERVVSIERFAESDDEELDEAAAAATDADGAAPQDVDAGDTVPVDMAAVTSEASDSQDDESADAAADDDDDDDDDETSTDGDD